MKPLVTPKKYCEVNMHSKKTDGHSKGNSPTVKAVIHTIWKEGVKVWLILRDESDAVQGEKERNFTYR